jgi:hypothetical protein
MLLDLVPDPHFQYGYGSRINVSMLIHADPVPGYTKLDTVLSLTFFS